jgi:pyridoxamine 5'-phosphate oxidase
MDLENLRREYLQGGLSREDLPANPIKQFEAWLQQAIDLQIHDPTAMVIATVDASGQPSQRMVLLKYLDAKGLVFFTNYGSRKARDIAVNSKVSLHFPWNDIERQVKIEGESTKISTAESLKYFLSRPHESQLAAWASPQSQPLSSKEILLTQVAHMREKYAKGEIPLPDFWGGIRVVPSLFEFWQGGEHRLHDRFEYRRQDDGLWVLQRLAP